jgi:PAS domain S-box-containing protein
MSFSPDNVLGLLDDLPEPLVVTTVEGEIAFVNGSLSALSGYSSDELIGEHVTKLMPQPERRRLDVVRWLTRWADNPDPEQLRYLNLELSTSAGTTLIVSVRVSRHEGDGGPWFLIVLRDVTSEHETLSKLRHAQLVTNRILAIGEDAVVSVDADHKISFWNRRAEQLFGYEEDEALGQSLSLVIPDRFADNHEAFISDFVNGAEASRLMGQRGEIVGRHRSGREIPLEASITKTVVEGEPILSAQVRDISERKKAEAALRTSEARFRSLFEHAFEAMVLLDASGWVLEINEAARKMLPDFNANKYFWELNWWDAEGAELEQFSDNLKQIVQDVQGGERVRTEVQLGSRKIDFSLMPVADSDGELNFIIAEGRDITAL